MQAKVVNGSCGSYFIRGTYTENKELKFDVLVNDKLFLTHTLTNITRDKVMYSKNLYSIQPSLIKNIFYNGLIEQTKKSLKGKE